MTAPIEDAARARPACRRCRGPPGSRSTSTRCAPTSPRSARSPARACRSDPVVKADAYGHGAVPVARALEAAGADGFCVARSTRRWSCGPAGIRGADPGPVPGPAGGGRRGGRDGRLSVTAGDAALLERTLAAAAAAAGRRPPPLAVQLEVETGLGRGGFDGRRASATPLGRLAAARGVAARGPVDAPPGARGRGPGRSPSWPGSRRRRGSLPAAGLDLPPRTSRPARASCPATSPAYDGVRPGPRHLRPRPRRAAGRDSPAPAPRAALRPVLSLHARPVRVADLPAGLGDQLRPDVHDRAAQPDRDAAARLRRRLVARALEPGRGPGPRAARPARRATSRWTR